MKLALALLTLLVASTIVSADRATAQAGRDSRDDAAGARIDSMLGTPNKVTPVPQTNRFSTSPGLEQQAPGSYAKDPPPKNDNTPQPPAGISR